MFVAKVVNGEILILKDGVPQANGFITIEQAQRVAFLMNLEESKS